MGPRARAARERRLSEEAQTNSTAVPPGSPASVAPSKNGILTHTKPALQFLPVDSSSHRHHNEAEAPTDTSREYFGAFPALATILQSSSHLPTMPQSPPDTSEHSGTRPQLDGISRSKTPPALFSLPQSLKPRTYTDTKPPFFLGKMNAQILNAVRARLKSAPSTLPLYTKPGPYDYGTVEYGMIIVSTS